MEKLQTFINGTRGQSSCTDLIPVDPPHLYFWVILLLLLHPIRQLWEWGRERGVLGSHPPKHRGWGRCSRGTGRRWWRGRATTRRGWGRRYHAGHGGRRWRSSTPGKRRWWRWRHSSRKWWWRRWHCTAWQGGWRWGWCPTTGNGGADHTVNVPSHL